MPQERFQQSPLIETLQKIFVNEITTQLAIRGISEGRPKYWEELQDRIEYIIENIPKSWYRKAFNSLPTRWEKRIKSFGAMTDF